jgi:N-acetylmuramoyl-L-alanine amidase
MEIQNFKLKIADNVEQLNCKKNTVKFSQGQPDTIIIHYTAGRNAESSARYLCNDDVKASAHVVIGRDGKIIQLVPFDTIAWHAGKSYYEGRVGFNKYSVGIELDNAGILDKAGNEYLSWFGKKYHADEVIQAIHPNENKEKFWHIFTEKQIQACEDLCTLLLKDYKTIKNILGHEEIAPGRKQDPGPAFPLKKIRELLLQERDSDESIYENLDAKVEASLLNIRELPDANSKTINEPLKKGTKLKILQKHKGWYKVKTEIEGWVASEYVSFE